MNNQNSQIAEKLRAQAFQLLSIADGLDGGAHQARPPAPAIDRDKMLTVPQTAAKWRLSEKTVREKAKQNGATVHIFGRVYIDDDIFTRAAICHDFPLLSISD